MHFSVINKELTVNQIYIIGISTSSVLLIGDANTIGASSVFDTPPESVIIRPLVPLAPAR
ncbi:spore gernimation protein GerPD [Terrilactibacillus sp. S3-3]|nr:spore gernimation protein GerPD [Terrilactibacillus sp. S3-3]